MKYPQIASLLVLISLASPAIAFADDFDAEGRPSAEIVDELAKDDLPVSPSPSTSNTADNTTSVQAASNTTQQ